MKPATPDRTNAAPRSLARALRLCACALPLLAAAAWLSQAQTPGNTSPRDGGPGFDGPPPFGQDGGGFGGPPGMQSETKLVKQYDADGNGWLNAAERKTAREQLAKQSAGQNRRGPGGRRGFGPQGGESQEAAQPGKKLSPADVKSYGDAPLFDAATLRTLFLEFENADWEKELAEFKNTDVEVPVKLTVDGKAYADVGVHFHGASSFFMVGEGRKRSLVLTLDLAHAGQNLGGYRKLNLLNAHEDASFLRTALAMQIARDYLPAPKVNLVRVVINGESWGLFVNQQHFDKDFLRDHFDTTKGARWKVRGSPNGRGGLNYLGDDPEAYRKVYDLKTKDTPKTWARFIKLCKVLNDTPADQLEAALEPIFDVDGALKFLAWENVLSNGDGFYTRASDYGIYLDESSRFHIIPYDANETFSAGGGPGGFGGPGGPGGRGGFGPGMFLAPQFLAQADKDADQKLSRAELTALADAWFDKLDAGKSGKVSQEQFVEKFNDLLPPPEGGPGSGPQGGGRGGFGPARFVGPAIFTAGDADKDGSLTRAELKDAFGRWHTEWDKDKSGALNEEQVRDGLNAALPRPNFAGPGAGPGGLGGGGGRRGSGGPGGFGGGGTELDPLVAAKDDAKPLLSKLLAVPALRERYLKHTRDIAEKWLDWGKLGPIAEQYHALIDADVKADTRKLDSYEAFANSLKDQSTAGGGPRVSLKTFADKRRAYLLNYKEAKNTTAASTTAAPTESK